jgi:hypothetical protein
METEPVSEDEKMLANIRRRVMELTYVANAAECRDLAAAARDLLEARTALAKLS